MSNRGTKVWYMCKLRQFELNGAHVPIKSIYKKPSIGLDPPQIVSSCTVVTYISLSFSVCSKSPATFPVTHHRNQTRKIIGPSIHPPPRMEEHHGSSSAYLQLFMDEATLYNRIVLGSLLPMKRWDPLPHFIQSWVRNCIGGTVIYFLSASLWCFYIYYLNRNLYFPTGIDISIILLF